MTDILGGSAPAVRAQRYGWVPPLPSIYRLPKLPTVSGAHCSGVIARVSAGLIVIVNVPDAC